MSRKQKKTLVRILISGALFAGAFFIPVEGIWKLGVYLIPYFVIGWDVCGRLSAIFPMARCSMKTF